VVHEPRKALGQALGRAGRVRLPKLIHRLLLLVEKRAKGRHAARPVLGKRVPARPGNHGPDGPAQTGTHDEKGRQSRGRHAEGDAAHDHGGRPRKKERRACPVRLHPPGLHDPFPHGPVLLLPERLTLLPEVLHGVVPVELFDDSGLELGQVVGGRMQINPYDLSSSEPAFLVLVVLEREVPPPREVEQNGRKERRGGFLEEDRSRRKLNVRGRACRISVGASPFPPQVQGNAAPHHNEEQKRPKHEIPRRGPVLPRQPLRKRHLDRILVPGLDLLSLKRRLHPPHRRLDSPRGRLDRHRIGREAEARRQHDAHVEVAGRHRGTGIQHVAVHDVAVAPLEKGPVHHVANRERSGCRALRVGPAHPHVVVRLRAAHRVDGNVRARDANIPDRRHVRIVDRAVGVGESALLEVVREGFLHLVRPVGPHLDRDVKVGNLVALLTVLPRSGARIGQNENERSKAASSQTSHTNRSDG